MIRSDREHPALPAKPLILLGIVKGYVRNPLLFMLAVKRRMKRLMKGLVAEFPRDFAELVALVAAVYLIAREKVGDDTALSLVSAVVLPVGLATQLANFRYVEDSRSFENLIAYQQRINREGPTRLNRMEILEQSGSRYRFKVHNCVFMQAFRALGVPELTPVICAIDNAIFNAYMPERVQFHRGCVGNRIADGADFCSFVFEHVGP
ncbi:MAG: L-2-amino-thiazoline-4-carboxylic acid hydrolase [Spirochaetes bacterium]|nr:L-2-amino-thiazoline-4-carboxylic acid hydrolase [Spirochaetota bacterium]